ncbi:MAG TPA: VOC family protein [Candidatus Xenobia bacterium]
MKQVIVNHLGFQGNCLEAMTFYAKVLGAEVEYMRYSEAPMPCPPESKDQIMHSRLVKDGECILMAADHPAHVPFQAGTNFCLSAWVGSVDDANRVFAALGEGGQTTMPLGETFFAERFGMVKDRFGIAWMVNYSGHKNVQLKSAKAATTR